MIDRRLVGRCVMAMSVAVAALCLANPAAYAAGTITITKAVMVERDAPNQEVTSGLADAYLYVDFRGDAQCSCSCTPTLTYTWQFGDGTTANGKNVSHTYGANGAGNNAPWLHVECTCGASADSNALSASAISGIHVDRIGDIENPTNNGRLCFNTELHVAATAEPVGVDGSDKIDWYVLVLLPATYLANTASGSLPDLADGDWPSSNSLWGNGTLYISIAGPFVPGQTGELSLTGASSYIHNNKSVRNFYNAASFENPTDDPNWFHYYKSNQGGSGYTYKSTGRSESVSAGGMSTVKIGNEAYAGDEYITHDYSNPGGRLKALGWSSTHEHYANFLGVLAHETQHATHQVNCGPPTDGDSDRLDDDFEIYTSLTDPNDQYSARGSLSGPDWYDREVYAGGPVEKAGIDGADTSNDWACPGTNWDP